MGSLGWSLALSNVDVDGRGRKCLPLRRLKGVHIGKPPRQVVHVLVLHLVTRGQPVVHHGVRLAWAWPRYEAALEQQGVEEASPRLRFQVRHFHRSVTNSVDHTRIPVNGIQNMSRLECMSLELPPRVGGD